MNIILLFDRMKNKMLKMYREKVFFKKTGCKVNLVKNVTLINTNLKIGRNVTIYPDVMFYGDGLIEIGNNVNIGNGTILYASKNGGITIENDVMIGAYSYITDTDHGINGNELISQQENSTSYVHIGSDVWIAANCTILKGSIIEDGAVIGAKSLVKGKVKANSISIGIPAKHLKFRGE